MLAAESPASFVAWDLLALGDEDLREVPQAERRARLETVLAGVKPPVHLTPATTDRATAADWFDRFEGAGLDGVIAKRARRAVPAGQARDAQDQAPAHGRLRRRRLSLAQERAGHARRVAAARPVRRRRQAQPRRHHVIVHVGPPGRAGRGARAAPRERGRGPSVAGMGGVGRLPATPRRRGSDCPGRPRAGTAARTCPGSRSAPSGSSRSPTTISRATGSATRRRSSAGARTSHPRRAATTSSKRPRPSSSRRSSAADGRLRLRRSLLDLRPGIGRGGRQSVSPQRAGLGRPASCST